MLNSFKTGRGTTIVLYRQVVQSTATFPQYQKWNIHFSTAVHVRKIFGETNKTRIKENNRLERYYSRLSHLPCLYPTFIQSYASHMIPKTIRNDPWASRCTSRCSSKWGRFSVLGMETYLVTCKGKCFNPYVIWLLPKDLQEFSVNVLPKVTVTENSPHWLLTRPEEHTL